jgi:hypothetical protein
MIILHIGITEERFIRYAIPAFVRSLIDVSGLFQAAKDLLHNAYMSWLCSADEVIIGNMQFFPCLLELG